MAKKFLRWLIKYVTALGGCIYLFLGGFLKPRNRDLLSEISRHFGFPRRPVTVKTELPVCAFSELVPEPPAVRILERGYARGNVSLLELVMINQLIAAYQPKHIFEFGTFDGRTTLNMAANSPEGAQIETLDLPQENIGNTGFLLEEQEKVLIDKPASGTRFSGRPESGKIRQHFGDSARFDFSAYEHRADFIFIDASHAYDYVLSDSRNALKLMDRNGGIILWHDYGAWNGVTRALNELRRTDSAFREIKQIEGTSLAILVI